MVSNPLLLLLCKQNNYVKRVIQCWI